MKNKFLIPTLALSATLVVFSGCKKESPIEKATEQTKDAAASAADALKSATESVKEGAEKAVDKTKEVAGEAMDKAKEGAAAVKAGAEKAMEKAKEVVASPAAPAADGAQTIIDKAQSLVGAGKFQDALSALGGLSGMTLSEAQQKIVDGLKAQIQKALAAKATESGAAAVGNLLGK